MNGEAEKILREAGAMLEGHFVLTSGRHSAVYWEKFRVLEQPRYTERLCQMIAAHFRDKGVELVAGPTTGGVIVAYEVARQLGARGVFAEKQGGTRVFRRGFQIRTRARVLVVDDVLTTGGSVQEVVAEVGRKGAELLGVGVLIDRSEERVDFGVPLFAAYRTSVATYRPDQCPLCQAGIDLVKPGGSEP